MKKEFDAEQITLTGSEGFMERLLVKDFPSLKEILSAFCLEGLPQSPASENFLQSYLTAIYEQFKERPQDFSFKELVLVNHLLSFYPLFYTHAFSRIFIPQKKEETLYLTPFKTEKIALTPKWLGSEISALVLENEKGESFLIFKPTPLPSSEGALLSYLTDMNPFSSVGGYLFYFAKEKVLKLLKANGETTVIGLSLGGALAQLTVSYFPEYVKEAFVYNAPALWKRDVRRAANKTLPKTYIFSNKNDLVCQTGTSRLNNSEEYQLEDRTAGRNNLIAHIRIYSADSEHKMVKRNQEIFPFKRYVLTTLHTLVSIPLFLIGVFVWGAKRLLNRDPIDPA